MAVYESLTKLTIDLLQRAKTARGEIHIVVGQLAEEHGLTERRYVEERLVSLHNTKVIQLSAFHEKAGVQPLEWWPTSEYFFAYGSDANHKRVLLLLEGERLLDEMSAPEKLEPTKRAIGFHG